MTDPPNFAANPHRQSPESGYVLFGVLAGVAILGIGLAAATTLWTQLAQREREAELVFRGEAIVAAIQRYQANRPGTLPDSLDELVEERLLRKVWRDPMTGNPFILIRANPDEEHDDRPTGVFGVRSASSEPSFRLYKGADRYDEWPFAIEITTNPEPAEPPE